MHPMEAYMGEAKDGHMADEIAKEDITGLVNDQDLLKDVCAIFHDRKNADATCYAIGKVYDVQGESYGCVSILSDDVINVIGESAQDTHEKLNYALISSFLEFRQLCIGRLELFSAWDGYLDFVVSRHFMPLFENGVRAQLIHNGRIGQTRLPTVVFVIYQQYEAVYG